MHFNLLTVGALLLSSLMRIGIAYAVRRGALTAKILLALGFVVLLYNGTYLEKGVVAGVDFAHFDVASLVLLFTGLRLGCG